MTCRTARTAETIILDPATLLFCAALARTAADGLPTDRARQARALRVLAEEIEGMATEPKA